MSICKPAFCLSHYTFLFLSLLIIHQSLTSTTSPVLMEMILEENESDFLLMDSDPDQNKEKTGEAEWEQDLISHMELLPFNDDHPQQDNNVASDPIDPNQVDCTLRLGLPDIPTSTIYCSAEVIEDYWAIRNGENAHEDHNQLEQSGNLAQSEFALAPPVHETANPNSTGLTGTTTPGASSSYMNIINPNYFGFGGPVCTFINPNYFAKPESTWTPPCHVPTTGKGKEKMESECNCAPKNGKKKRFGQSNYPSFF